MLRAVMSGLEFLDSSVQGAEARDTVSSRAGWALWQDPIYNKQQNHKYFPTTVSCFLAPKKL